jgi:1,4-alpha-glucan branching enzyme
MPINEFPGEISWGYNPVFYIAPESAYGTPDEFKRLVNEAHKRGIAVILDVVLNHSEGWCPLHLLYDDINENPWYHDYHAPFSWANWGPEFDHDRPATQQVVDFILKTWVEEFHIDGFRIDVAWGLADPYQNNSAGSLKRKAVLGRICEQVAQYKQNLYLVAEYFPPDVGMEAYIVADTRLDAMWHDTFHWGMKDLLKPNISVDRLNEFVNFAGKWHNGYFTDAGQVVNYTANHDEQRTIYEFVTYQSGDYATAVRLEKATGAVLLTAAGTPMLYHGQEFGQDTKKTVDRNPLKWNYLDDPVHQGIYNYYRRLIWLRQNLKVLRSNNYLTLQKHNNQTFVYQRADANEQIVVAVNFHRNSNDILNIQFPHAGPWYEFITDDSVEVNATNVLENFELPYASARIFVNQRAWKDLDIPAEPTSVNEANASSMPERFGLAQNYPNPFNNLTTIKYSLIEPKPVETTVKILNLLGQEVKTLVDEKQAAGEYQIVWNGLDYSGKPVSSGVYLYSLRSGSYDATKKLVFIK